MLTEVFTPDELARFDVVWAEYQRTHDVSGQYGQVVGVDPRTGEVFIGGRTSGELMERLRSEGRWRPLIVSRVGMPAYGRVREGRRRPVNLEPRSGGSR